MASISKREIQNKVAEYLAEEITLGDFQDWLAPHAWAIDDDTEEMISGLIYSLELQIAEYDAGHQLRDVFVDELQVLASGVLETESASSDISHEVGEPPNPFECAYSLFSGESSLRLAGSA